tara:strand:- start:196 stop:1218 length:1023 start_codon:yes stop_codon:yes gene_type:complete
MNTLIEQYKLFNNSNLLIDYITYHKVMVYDEIPDPQLIINLCKINYMDLEFRYDSNNLRIPYYNNKKLLAIKIDLDEIYNYISSNSLIPDDQIICGEKLQRIVDIVIGNPSSLCFNPNNIFFSKEMKSIQELNDISKYNSIFVFTHDLEDFYNKFGDQLSTKIIVSHNSDHEIRYIKNVKLHLAQNCLIKNSKLTSLPIGIENRQWFDHNIFHKIRKLKIKKTKNIYFYFNLNTHPCRLTCYNMLKDKLEWNTKRSKEDYFIELASHKYAICPRGNGLDTHRIWECLYLNVIPIIIEKDDLKIDNLPIIILEDWSSIDNLESAFTKQINNKIVINNYLHP